MTTLITLISVNGILQSRSEYTENGTTITFKKAPTSGATIDIMVKDNHLTYVGNGTNCVFHMPHEVREEVMYKQFMDHVWKHRDNPTVKDQLEKLKIVMELIR